MRIGRQAESDEWMGLLCIATATLPKIFYAGTHRSANPVDTLARWQQHATAMGITRLGDITGLDRIGIPVAIAVRPNSRSVSVAQGKGICLAQAYTSAFMEAAEAFHGEQLQERFRRTSYRQLKKTATAVNPIRLSRSKAFDTERAIDWIEGFDVLAQRPVWVPAEVVHTDYTTSHRPDSGSLLRGSNGLGSGNHVLEAIASALFELVERDATSLWSTCDIRQQARYHLDYLSIDDVASCKLLERFNEAGFTVRIWDVTSDIGIATFICDILQRPGDSAAGSRRFRGAGCHPDRVVALCRALTEAAQTRLTYIAGSRDDLAPDDYVSRPDDVLGEATLDVLLEQQTPRRFGDVPDMVTGCIAQDLRWALARLRAAGFPQVVVINLTLRELGIPVVRAIIPGLEGDCRHPDYVPGARAWRAAGRP